MCHVASLSKSEGLTSFQERSWISLHNAESNRQDETFDFLRKEGVSAESEPGGVYHRNCYQDYTNKTNLTRLVKKRKLSADAQCHVGDVTASASSDVFTDALSLPHLRVLWPASTHLLMVRRNAALERQSPKLTLPCVCFVVQLRSWTNTTKRNSADVKWIVLWRLLIVLWMQLGLVMTHGFS